MNIKDLRIELHKIVLELEKVEGTNKRLSLIPSPIITKLENLTRDAVKMSKEL